MLVRNVEIFREIYKKISELIQSVVKTEEREVLKKAVGQCDEAIRLYPEESSLKKKLFESYVLFITMTLEYDVDEQARAWENFANAHEIFTLDMGREYLINQFLKPLYQAKHYMQAIRVCDAVMFACVYLYSEFVWKQEESKIYDDFNKKVSLYLELSRKGLSSQQCSESKGEFSRTERINFETLDGLPEWDKEPILTLQIGARQLISQSYQEYLSNKKLLNKQTIQIAHLLSVIAISEFYLHDVTVLINSKHRQQLLNDYRSSNLLGYIQKSVNLISKGNIYHFLAESFVEIFTNSFPMMEIEKAELFINKIKVNILTVHKQDMENQLLSKLSKSIVVALDGFFQDYKKINKLYIECNEKISNPDVFLSELLALEKKLNGSIAKTLPKPWRVIFHEKIAELNLLLKWKDKKNTNQYKKSIINHLQIAKEISPQFRMTTNLLYHAEINAFEVHDDLNKILNSIKSDINQINKNITSSSQSLFLNFYQYLRSITIYYSPLTYRTNESLSTNIVGLISHALKQKNIAEAIQCWQAIEQLLRATEFEKKLPDVYQAIVGEIRKFNQDAQQYDSFVLRKEEQKKLSLVAKISFFNTSKVETKAVLINRDRVQPAELSLIQIKLDTQRNELAAKRDEVLLSGAGKKIPPKSLSILFNLDRALRDLGTHLFIKGSVATRFGIYLYNDSPALAGSFPINDIDIHIPFHSDVENIDLINIIEQYGFALNKVKSENHLYLQFNQSVGELDIDLTLSTDANYCSFDFLPLRMGAVEFVHDGEINAENVVQTSLYAFKIIPPVDFTNEFISDCQFKEFTIQPPDARFRSYCYGAYNYLVKLGACEIEYSTDIIHSSGLYPALIEYFKSQLQSNKTGCYLELLDFIKKGIFPGTESLAANFIYTFFYAMLTDKVCDNKEVIALNCANHFIKYYRSYSDYDISPEYVKPESDLIRVVQTIVDSELEANSEMMEMPEVHQYQNSFRR